MIGRKREALRLRMLIAIIVPVYNTDKYLKRCVESLLNQTLHDIYIYLIDDGSTDSSGRLCDQLAQIDSRIIVFHNKNVGHYQERNIAIKEARNQGIEYIGFVDSDDWIEPDMFEALLRRANDTGADIVECGFYSHYVNAEYISLPEKNGVLNSKEALCELFRGKSYDYLWNKLWKTTCFDHYIISPVRAYEDMVITYRLYARARKIALIKEAYYHYFLNTESIIHQRDMRLIRLWKSRKERYYYIKTEMQGKINSDIYIEIEDYQLLRCIHAIGKNFAWWIGNSRVEQNRNQLELKHMSAFVRSNTPIFGRKGWGRYSRFVSFAARFPYKPVLWCMWYLNHMDRKFRKRDISY